MHARAHTIQAKIQSSKIIPIIHKHTHTPHTTCAHTHTNTHTHSHTHKHTHTQKHKHTQMCEQYVATAHTMESNT